MAEPDYSLAAQIKPPTAANPLETLIGLENFRRLQTENAIKGLELKQKGIDTQSLQNYGQSGNLLDMRGSTPELRESSSRTDKNDFELGAEHRARVAQELLAEKDPKEKLKKWQEAGDDWAKRGWVHRDEWQRIRNNPSDLVLNGVIRKSMGVAPYMGATGQTAAADAAGRAPYEGRPMPAAEPYGYPAVQPGGPLANGSPVGTVPRPGAAPMTPGPVTPPPSSKAAADTYNQKDPYYNEAPSHPIGPPMPTGQGIVRQGTNPLAMSAAQEGLKQAQTYSDQAGAAAKDQAELNSLRSELQSNKASTGMFTEVKMTVAGAIYGLTKDPDLAKNLTGISLPWNEVFAKDATRRGLTFARQTEGAREAVMAIQIALRANPGLLNTREGNLKMVDILEAGDKYDQEMSRGAQAYMMKQQDTHGTPHLVGFQDHFITAHHPATFVSKAVPYQLPPDVGQLKDGVTYEYPTPAKDKSGKPILGVGTYNAKTQHFDPVQQ